MSWWWTAPILSEVGPDNLTRSFGGDTLNTSVYLARLLAARDVAIDYVTALGDDPFSDAMIAGWRDEGIGTDLVARLPGRLPGIYVIRTDAAGERSFYPHGIHGAFALRPWPPPRTLRGRTTDPVFQSVHRRPLHSRGITWRVSLDS